MKVVINRCYGGFATSKAAHTRLLALGCPHVEKKWDGYGYEHERSIEHRACPMLVQVVEELGDKANASLAALKVVEVPDGVPCHLDDYDGMECVAEDHETWS